MECFRGNFTYSLYIKKVILNIHFLLMINITFSPSFVSLFYLVNDTFNSFSKSIQHELDGALLNKNGCNERKQIFKCTNVPFENFFQQCQSKNETNYEESIFLLNKDVCLAIST